MSNIVSKKNKPNWFPSDDDYELVFCSVDGVFRELGHNLSKFSNMTLADYLLLMNITIPDYTQFLRIYHPDYLLEYRSYGGRVRIDYKKRDLI